VPDRSSGQDRLARTNFGTVFVPRNDRGCRQIGRAASIGTARPGQKPLWQRRKSHFCDYRHSALGGLPRQWDV